MGMIKVITVIVGMIQTNCYLVVNEINKKTVIIDPGGNHTLIKSKCRERGLRPIGILLTHGHFDHMMAADALRAVYRIPICAGIAEKGLLADAGLNGSYMIGKNITLNADEWLYDDAVLFGMRVITTPGHTAGSVCFYNQNENILFSGDTLFKTSFGRTDFPTGDFETLMDSIKQKLFSLPDNTIVYPGHDKKTDIGFEKINNSLWGYT
jgi:glyoxylase-like metal-dependent hydrolase (beta-lactamase superfamily II)